MEPGDILVHLEHSMADFSHTPSGAVFHLRHPLPARLLRRGIPKENGASEPEGQFPREERKGVARHRAALLSLVLRLHDGDYSHCLNVREGNAPPHHLQESRALRRDIQAGTQRGTIYESLLQLGMGHLHRIASAAGGVGKSGCARTRLQATGQRLPEVTQQYGYRKCYTRCHPALDYTLHTPDEAAGAGGIHLRPESYIPKHTLLDELSQPSRHYRTDWYGTYRKAMQLRMRLSEYVTPSPRILRGHRHTHHHGIQGGARLGNHREIFPSGRGKHLARAGILAVDTQQVEARPQRTDRLQRQRK